MSQADNSKRRITKILQNLAIQLNRVGLSDRIELRATNDPWADLEGAYQGLLAVAITSDDNPRKLSQESQLTKNNQAIVLDCLKFFISIHMELSKFSKMLYEGDHSRQIYKSYRKLYEAISTASNCLYQFQSDNQQFLREKQDLITENLQICEQIQSADGNQDKLVKNKEKNINADSDNEELVESLRKQIDALNEMIRQNDDEFTLQIQRYNNTLFDMQETIRQYEIRMDKVREYEASIDDLEHKLIRLKQQKYRDDMLIDNMSKKIRFYEKQRGGVDAFLSPRGNNYSRKNMVVSPVNRFSNQNQSMMGLNPLEQKSKNYYGERLTSN